MRYRLDIQGLRAVAVLSILIFHADPAWLPGGFVGVDIFFVISGFVITSVVVRDLGRGSFSLADFYRKRVARIFPALYVVLAATLVAGYFLLIPRDFEELGETTIATIFYVSNFAFMRLSGYFDGAAEMKPLLHTWSLAVEEQFYVVYPIALALVWRFRRAWLPAAFAVGIASSLALCIWLLEIRPEAAFYLSPPRAFELLIGAAIAALPGIRIESQRLREGAAILGAALIAVSIGLYSAEMTFPGLAALPPTVGTALIIVAGKDEAPGVGRALSWQPLVYVGAISYSLYLWHWPLIVYARHITGAHLNAAEAIGMIVLSVVLAALSYRFIEQPFQRGGRLAALPFLRLGTGTMVAAAVVAGLVVFLDGMPDRYSQRALAAFSQADDISPFRASCHQERDDLVTFGELCRLGTPGARPDAIVWGDSHGVEIAAALGERAQKTGRALVQSTMSACPPSLGYNPPSRPLCERHNDDTLNGVLADPAIGTVVLADYFSVYRRDDEAAMLAGYRDLVTKLSAAGRNVVLLSPIPVYDFDPPTAIGQSIAFNEDPSSLALPMSEYVEANRPALDLLAELDGLPGVDVVQVDRLLCNSAVCDPYDKNAEPLYFNATHLSMSGARLVAEQIRY